MTTETSYLLSVICAMPLMAALIVLLLPASRVRSIRHVTVGAMVLLFGTSLLLLRGNYDTAELQFTERYALVPHFGINYSVGVDGLSLWLVILTTFITPLATYASWSHIDNKLKTYACSLLILESAILGAFVALDVLLFYALWELTLVPMFFIIGLWGGTRRAYAALKFFLFTAAGGALMLVAILYLAMQYHAVTGHYSFELRDLKQLLLPTQVQVWLFGAFALAFAIKVPVFPFHTWLPDAYVQAPTGGSVMMSAVMAKLATYGFLRFAMPLFPWGSHQASATIVLLAVVGVIYGAFCAFSQSDVKKLVAYSSLSHLGFVMLGIYSVSSTGLRGSILQMVNHGISTGALFLLVGVLYERRNTRILGEFGGVAKVMPVFAAVFVLVTLSAIGLPTTNGFIGEFMILGGAFTSEMLGQHGPIAALFAGSALVLAPMYALHAVFKLFWGPLNRPENGQLMDLTGRERIVFAPLLALIFYIGLFPNHMLQPMSASVDRFVLEYGAKLRASDQNPNGRGLLEERFEPVRPPPRTPPDDRMPLASTLPPSD